MYKQKMTYLILVIVTVVSTSIHVAGQFSKATLHPNCLKTDSTRRLSAEWGMRLFAGANFYIPYGSSQAIHHFSKLLASGSKGDVRTTKETDIKNLCTLVRIRGFKLQMEGHGGNFMIQDCSFIKKGMNDCKIDSLSENPKYQKNGDAIVIIVWTDNKTTMAIVRCSADGLYNDWYTFSTLTSLNETMKQDILSAVTKLGFPHQPENALSPSYEGCQLFPPEKEDD